MHDNEYQLLIQNKLPGISGFVQTLAGYYCQFLETDFKKSREPKRKFLNRDNLGRKVGIRTSKYSHFKNLLVDEINFKKQNSNIVIESNKYKSSLPASTEVSIITAIDTIDLDSLSNDFLPLEKNIYRQLGIPNSNIQKFISAEISPVGRDLAHEIRGPLAGIRANTEALSLSMSSDDFKIFQQNIIDNTSQMNKLVEGLTLLSEIEGQGKGLKTENFNIKKAIKNTINNQETNQRINDKNINIPIKQIDDNIFLVANQNLIEICFSNIINNAIDFSSNGKDIYIEVIEKRKYIYKYL
jgi:signal transduction histidine kinase